MWPHLPHQQADGKRKNRHPVEIPIDGRAAHPHFSFGGGLPFQKPFPRHHAPHQRTHHGIQRKQHLVSQEDQRQQHREIGRQKCADRLARRGRLLLDRRLHQPKAQLKPDRDEEDENGCDCPAHGTARGNQPAKYQQHEGGRLDQAAPQVVENFPAGNERDRIGHSRAGFFGHLRSQPSRDLPVSAQPAMFAAIVGAVVRGIILDHLDVAGQSRAGVGALDQIVAE